jgi:fibronectin type 3 domain-containing protein
MRRSLASFVCVLAASLPLSAELPRRPAANLERLVVPLPAAYIPSASVPLEELASEPLVNRPAYDAFRSRYGFGWSVFLNPNTGRPSYIGGEGIPMIPGHGNTLTAAELLGDPSKRPSVEDVDRIVRRFVAEQREIFQLDDRDLTLRKGSGFHGNRDYLCFLVYQISHGGVPIEGATFQARLNNGNLVDMGFSGQYVPPSLSSVPKVTVESARWIVRDHLAELVPATLLTDAGTLKYVPLFLGSEAPWGERIGHALVWEIAFVVGSGPEHWVAWVDANSGAILRLLDDARSDTYKKIHGQVYLENYGGGATLQERAFPFVREDTRGVASVLGGRYPYPGGTSSCTLNDAAHPDGSTLVWVHETCSTQPSLGVSDGNLDWGGTEVQDCAYTGSPHGDATEAGLMAIYHVTQKKLLAFSYLPGNVWLGQALQVGVNGGGTECNAFWGDGRLMMYRSVDGKCHNFGLMVDILAHELGHGLDAGDASEGSDYGTGEIYGDVMGALYVHDSCHGRNARFSNCDPDGNACLDCSGRELDYMEKVRQVPSTPKNLVCTDCPEAPGYPDPCGREGHCAASGMGEAVWDLVARDLPTISGMTASTAWQRLTELFYLSRDVSEGMYDCTPQTSCSEWTSSGCGAVNWYRTFRIVDDDNGNLCDGTPNAAAIHSAFARHEIACAHIGGCPNESTSHTVCPSLAAPVLAPLTANACSIDLDWGPVSGAVEYRILRSEIGSDREFMVLATLPASIDSYRDATVSTGVPHWYAIQAIAGNPSCESALSTIRSATATECPACVIPTSPAAPICTPSGGQVLVTWSAVGGADGYRVYRRRGDEFNWTNLAELAAGVTSYPDTGIFCSREYRYRIVSLESTAGVCESLPSPETLVDSTPCCTPPGAPYLESIAGGCEGIELAWSPGSGTTSSYRVYRRLGTDVGPYVMLAGPITATTYVDEAVPPGEIYAYVVRGACDAEGFGLSSSSNRRTAMRDPLPARSDEPTLEFGSCSSGRVTWKAVAEATSYDLYRKVGSCGIGVRIATGLTDLFFDQSGLSPLEVYGYRVVAKNACGEMAGICGLSSTGPEPFVYPPYYNIVRSDRIEVGWGSRDRATSYDLYRATGGCGTAVLLASDLTDPWYTDTDVDCTTTYGYSVVAKSACATGPIGPCSSATTPGPPPASPPAPTFSDVDNDTVRITWELADDATSYDVHRRLEGCGTGGLVASGLTGTTFLDDGLLCDQAYGYYVVARSPCGVAPPGECATVTTTNIPPARAGAPFSWNQGCTWVEVRWLAVATATSYDLRRKLGECGPGSLVAEGLTGTSFQDTALSKGAQYSYYVVSKNACGVAADGPCGIVTLDDDPPNPTSLILAPDCDSISLSWSHGGGADGFKVYRTSETSCVGAMEMIGTPSSASFDDTSAASGVFYQYKVTAVNDCGESGPSSCLGAQRLAAPSQVTGLSASPTCGSVSLVWGAATGATSYTIYRTTNPDCTTDLASVGTTTGITFDDSTAALGTTYHYVVAASNGCGEGTKSTCVSGSRMTEPAAPGAPTFSNVQCQTLTVSWGSVPTAIRYDLYRKEGACGTATLLADNWNGTSYNDTFLTSNTEYSYYVAAQNGCGISPPGPCASVTTTDLPATPTGLVVDAVCPTITLKWNPAARATEYLVWRTLNPDCATNLGQFVVTGTTFSDPTAAAGFTYFYKIQARNGCGVSVGSSSCVGATKGTTPSPPVAVSGAPGCVSVEVTWQPADGATSYAILRSSDSNCTTGLAEIGTSSTTSFTDTSAVAGLFYYYRVRASNGCGTSNISACSSGVELLTPPSAPTLPSFPAVGCDSLTVSWPAVGGTTSYDLHRQTGSCGPGSLVASGITGTSYPDSGLTAGSVYGYYVVANNGCGPSANGACRTVTPGVPAAPSSPTATGECSWIDVRWSEVGGATSYEVWRTTASDCGTALTKVATVGAEMPDYMDADVQSGITYRYRIQAANACGTSNFSDCASATLRVNPPRPAAVSAVGTCAGVDLTWSASAGADQYVVSRTENPDCVTGMAMVGATTSLAFSDTTASPGVDYCYRIQAVSFCGGSPVSDPASARRLDPAAPTISGLPMNGCPDLTVTLTTETGMSGYQWYLGGSPIVGANGSVHEATESGVYTVSYAGANGCPGLSSELPIMVYVCGPPNIVYFSLGLPTPVDEDLDGVLEAGEKWRIEVTVTNTGERHATQVLGSLAGNGLYVCDNPGSFGTVTVGGTASRTFDFIPNPSYWYGTGMCGGSISLDLVDKSSNGGAYAFANDEDFTYLTVGSPGMPSWEWSGQSDPLDAEDAIDSSTLVPAPVGSVHDVVAASASWMLYGDANLTDCVALRLRAPSGGEEIVLKGTGQMDSGSADVLDFYRGHGPGLYTLVLEELSGCGSGAAHIVAGQLSVQLDGGCSLWGAVCSVAVPEVSDDAAHPLLVHKNGGGVEIRFEDVGASHYQAYVSTQAASGPFLVNAPNGRTDCGLDGWIPAPGGMLSIDGYDLQGSIPGNPSTLFLLVTADNGPGSEGSLGHQTGGTERTAESYCRR